MEDIRRRKGKMKEGNERGRGPMRETEGFVVKGVGGSVSPVMDIKAGMWDEEHGVLQRNIE